MSGRQSADNATKGALLATERGAPLGGAGGGRGLLLRILWLSVFLFYLEMAVIRFVSTEIRIFAYFKNLALLAAFFGLGIGCLTASRTRRPLAATFPLLALFVLAVLAPKRLGFDPYAQITRLLGGFNELAVWQVAQSPGLNLGWRAVALLLLTILVAWIALLFVEGGRHLADLLGACPGRIAAYSANVAGSLIGIWLFTATCAFNLPPIAWVWILFALGAPLVRQRIEAVVMGVAAAVLVVAAVTLPAEPGVVQWSPYQKLSTRPMVVQYADGAVVNVGTLMEVNGAFYQRLVDLSPRYIARHMTLWPEAANLEYLSYNLVYRVRPRPQNVLIVGAGAGNDAAAALRNGALHVDAVEIDPVIAHMGRSLHPERPYQDPRVRVHVDDARSFFKKTKSKYDLIVFGALDSHTLASTLSNVQIDNYVYTLEAFREARSLLAADGVLCVVFDADQPFIGVRIHEMLRQAFGAPPVVVKTQEIAMLGGAGGGPTYLADKDGRVARALSEDPLLADVVRKQTIIFDGAVPPSTDDWPYLYLERRTIPNLHRIVMTILLLLGAAAVRPLVGGLRRIQFFYFLTGAAFLLIEVQAISKLALLFGTTWFVNAVAISAVLAMILLANLLAATTPGRAVAPLYAFLAASLVLNLVFPFSILLSLPTLAKGLAAGAVMGLPILFAGMIFARVFAESADPGLALGSNLLGALVGGCCESLSFVTGINALGIVALVFYAGSLAVLLRKRPG